MTAKGGKPALRALDDHEVMLLAMPSIASQFPIVFTNGSRWSIYKGQCKSCSTEIADDCLSGNVSRIAGAAVIDALGYCGACHIYTRFLLRLFPDMTATMLDDDGSWKRWHARPKSLIRRLRAILRNLAP